MNWINAVNQFWFEDLGPNDWFRGGQLDSLGLVAAVIVFDQFSRNLFRKSAEAYATDYLALTLASSGVNRGLDASLGLHQRQFLYMPFMHSEDPKMQAHSVALFGRLGDSELLGYAEHHHGVIKRFGRFPRRNAVLGRQSTGSEREFLRREAQFETA